MKAKINILSIVFLTIFSLSQSVIFSQTVRISKGNCYISSSSKNGIKTYKIKNSKKDFSIEYEGKITLSDDDKDIIAISRGGFIEIKKSSFGRKRRIVIEAEGGKLNKRYYVGWSEKNFYPDGKIWLSDILPDIVRSTVIAAEARVERFYKKGGANAVLREIKRLESDFVKSTYFKLLLEHNLNESNLVSLINAAGNQLSSDYYLSQVLTKNQKKFLQNDRTTTAYINAAKNIGSDHYITEVIKKVIKDKTISDSQLGGLLKISESVGSDHYLSVILKGIMDNRELNTQNMEKVLQISKQIGSDHYKTQILKKAIQSKNLSSKAYLSFMSTMSDISSDHYLTEIIKELLKKKLDNASLKKLLELIKNSISSDHYATLLYKKMAKRNDLTESQIIIIINNLGSTINSSHYLSQTLLAYSSRVKKGSSKLKEAYTKAAKEINSDTYFGKTMKAIY